MKINERYGMVWYGMEWYGVVGSSAESWVGDVGWCGEVGGGSRIYVLDFNQRSNLLQCIVKKEEGRKIR